jgi:hypothetical protein
MVHNSADQKENSSVDWTVYSKAGTSDANWAAPMAVRTADLKAVKTDGTWAARKAAS